MEKEISSGTMLGIVLIALAAVIGLGFGVFSIAKGVANEGTVGVQDNLAAVSASSFDDYNDKIVTGTMVRSAVQNFNGKSVGILINTTAMDKAVIAYKEHSVLNTYKMDTTTGAVTIDTNLGCTGGAKLGDKVSNAHYYVNYNALFGDTVDATGKVSWATSTGNATMVLKDGVFNAAGVPFAVDSATGKVQFDYSVGGFTRTGNCEYLSPTAKFDANLIKDETDTIIGIVFTQRAQ